LVGRFSLLSHAGQEEVACLLGAACGAQTRDLEGARGGGIEWPVRARLLPPRPRLGAQRTPRLEIAQECLEQGRCVPQVLQTHVVAARSLLGLNAEDELGSKERQEQIL